MNILILTYWSYKDALIQTYTLPYVRIIRKQISASSQLFLFTFEQTHLKMTKEEWIKEKQKLKTEGIELIRFSYSRFGLLAALKFLGVLFCLLSLVFFKKIRYIHAWCTPAGSMGYLLSALTNRNLIIDSYEPHAESMVENGTWQKNSLAFKLLWWLEKKQSKKASAVIATSLGMKDYAKEKYNVALEKFFVKPSCVDLHLFNPEKEKDSSILDGFDINGKIVGIYAGKFGGIYLEQEVFDFFKVADAYWKERFRFIILTNTPKQNIMDSLNENGLNPDKFLIKFVLHHQISAYMQWAHYAINPVKPVPTKRYCTSIKDGEYWAMGLPVIITKNISDDSLIISQQNIGYVWNELSDIEYLQSIKHIEHLLTDNTLKQKIRKTAVEYRSYGVAEQIYKTIYSSTDK